MNKTDTLVLITQTLMQAEGFTSPYLCEISLTAERCNALVEASNDQVNAAVIELARRYGVGVPV